MTLLDLIRKITAICQITRAPQSVHEFLTLTQYQQLQHFLRDAVNDIQLKKDFPSQARVAHLAGMGANQLVHLGYIDRHGNLIQSDAQTPLQLPPEVIGSRLQLPIDYLRPHRVTPYYNEEDWLRGKPVTSPYDWQSWIDWGYTYGDRFRINEQLKYLETIPPVVFESSPVTGDPQFWIAGEIANQAESTARFQEINAWPLSALSNEITTQLRFWDITPHPDGRPSRSSLGSTTARDIYDIDPVVDNARFDRGNARRLQFQSTENTIYIGRTNTHLVIASIKNSPSVPDQQEQVALTITEAGQPVLRQSEQSTTDKIQFNYITNTWLYDRDTGSYYSEIPVQGAESLYTSLDHELIYYATCARWYAFKGWQNAIMFQQEFESKLASKHKDSKASQPAILGSSNKYNDGIRWNQDYEIAAPYRITG